MLLYCTKWPCVVTLSVYVDSSDCHVKYLAAEAPSASRINDDSFLRLWPGCNDPLESIPIKQLNFVCTRLARGSRAPGGGARCCTLQSSLR